MPVTGQISDQFVRELAGMSGRPLECPAARQIVVLLKLMRLKSGIWVAAYLRRCNVEGVFAAVRRRGAEEAGAIFIKINRLDGTAMLYGPAPQSRLRGCAAGRPCLRGVVGPWSRPPDADDRSASRARKSASIRMFGLSKSRTAPVGNFLDNIFAA